MATKGHTAPHCDGFYSTTELAALAHVTVQAIRIMAARQAWQVCGIAGMSYAYYDAADPAIVAFLEKRRKKLERNGQPLELPPRPPKRNIIPAPPKKSNIPPAPAADPVARLEERLLGNAHALAKELYPRQYQQRFARKQRATS